MNRDEGAALSSALGVVGLFLTIAVPPAGLPILVVWFGWWTQRRKKAANRQAIFDDQKAWKKRMDDIKFLKAL